MGEVATRRVAALLVVTRHVPEPPALLLLEVAPAVDAAAVITPIRVVAVYEDTRVRIARLHLARERDVVGDARAVCGERTSLVKPSRGDERNGDEGGDGGLARRAHNPREDCGQRALIISTVERALELCVRVLRLLQAPHAEAGRACAHLINRELHHRPVARAVEIDVRLVRVEHGVHWHALRVMLTQRLE